MAKQSMIQRELKREKLVAKYAKKRAALKATIRNILTRENPAGIEPLAPEAAVVFALSPLVGTALTTSAKFAVVCKSPLTQRLNDALSSSHFAMAAKRAGFDALVVTGSCAQPSVLVVDGCGETPTVHLEAAEDLWGLSAADAEARLKARLHRPDEPGFHPRWSRRSPRRPRT